MVPLRIGIHVGEVLIEDDKVFGDGVNLASRIESLGQAGTVMYSDNVYQKIKNNLSFSSRSLGAFEFKNVAEPMEVFALSNKGFPVPRKADLAGKLKNANGAHGHPSRKAIGIAILVAFIMVALGWFGYSFLNADPELEQADSPGQYSIMVLPFENFSSMPDQLFFVNGIADEIRSQLFSIKNLKVISRSSSNYYKDQKISLQQINKELDVAYVLEGTVQRIEDMVKVNVQLSNAETQEVVWSSPSFQEKLQDIFILQNKISQQIVTQLQVGMSLQEKMQLVKIPTRNADAYIYYQKGQELIKRGAGKIEELDSAIGLFEKAIELDPNFSLAWVGLSESYLEYVFWGRYPSNLILPKALDAAFRALELDDDKVEIYAALGTINFYRYEGVKAKEYLEKAIELSPNYHPPYEWLAWINIFENNHDGALQLFKKAHELEPLAAKYLGDQGLGYYYLDMVDEGLKFMDDVLQKYPTDNFLLWVHGCLYVAKEDYDRAIATFKKRSAGTNSNWMLGYAYAMSGRTQEAREILQMQLDKRKTQHVPAFMIATLYMGLGDADKALEWLEIDWEEKGQGVLYWGLKTDKRFDPLRGNPKFQELIEKVSY